MAVPDDAVGKVHPKRRSTRDPVETFQVLIENLAAGAHETGLESSHIPAFEKLVQWVAIAHFHGMPKNVLSQFVTALFDTFAQVQLIYVEEWHALFDCIDLVLYRLKSLGYEYVDVFWRTFLILTGRVGCGRLSKSPPDLQLRILRPIFVTASIIMNLHGPEKLLDLCGRPLDSHFEFLEKHPLCMEVVLKVLIRGILCLPHYAFSANVTAVFLIKNAVLAPVSVLRRAGLEGIKALYVAKIGCDDVVDLNRTVRKLSCSETRKAYDAVVCRIKRDESPKLDEVYELVHFWLDANNMHNGGGDMPADAAWVVATADEYLPYCARDPQFWNEHGSPRVFDGNRSTKITSGLTATEVAGDTSKASARGSRGIDGAVPKTKQNSNASLSTFTVEAEDQQLDYRASVTPTSTPPYEPRLTGWAEMEPELIETRDQVVNSGHNSSAKSHLLPRHEQNGCLDNIADISIGEVTNPPKLRMRIRKAASDVKTKLRTGLGIHASAQDLLDIEGRILRTAEPDASEHNDSHPTLSTGGFLHPLRGIHPRTEKLPTTDRGMDTPNVDVSMHSLHRSSQTARLPKRDSDDVELPSVLPLNRAALKRSDTKGSLESTQITAQISERPHMNHTKKAASVEDSDSRCTSEDPAKGDSKFFLDERARRRDGRRTEVIRRPTSSLERRERSPEYNRLLNAKSDGKPKKYATVQKHVPAPPVTDRHHSDSDPSESPIQARLPRTLLGRVKEQVSIHSRLNTTQRKHSVPEEFDRSSYEYASTSDRTGPAQQQPLCSLRDKVKNSTKKVERGQDRRKTDYSRQISDQDRSISKDTILDDLSRTTKTSHKLSRHNADITDHTSEGSLAKKPEEVRLDLQGLLDRMQKGPRFSKDIANAIEELVRLTTEYPWVVENTIGMVFSLFLPLVYNLNSHVAAEAVAALEVMMPLVEKRLHLVAPQIVEALCNNMQNARTSDHSKKVFDQILTMQEDRAAGLLAPLSSHISTMMKRNKKEAFAFVTLKYADTLRRAFPHAPKSQAPAVQVLQFVKNVLIWTTNYGDVDSSAKPEIVAVDALIQQSIRSFGMEIVNKVCYDYKDVIKMFLARRNDKNAVMSAANNGPKLQKVVVRKSSLMAFKKRTR